MRHQPIWSFPKSPFPFSLYEEGEAGDPLEHFHESSGLTIFEDEKCIYAEAAVPGIQVEDIEMIFENGILWITALKKEAIDEDKKKFYRKAPGSFSYRFAIPLNVDETKQPEAVCKNGVLKITFTKKKGKTAKKTLCARKG